MKASSTSLPEETAKYLLVPCISHQPTFYNRASQQLCISLHVLFMLCVLSSMVSRHFSAVVVHLSILFVLAGSLISLLPTFVITFFYLCVFLKIFLLRLLSSIREGYKGLDEGDVGNYTCQRQLILDLSIPAFQ